jgi:nucleolar protein 56
MPYQPGRRDSFLKKAREQTQEALRSKDVLLAHLSRAMEELVKVINLLHERLNTMYSIYFPELDVKDSKKYAEVVAIFDRKNLDMQALSKRMGQVKAQELVQKASATLGVDFTEEDLRACQLMAVQILSMHTLLEQYEEYREKLAQEICPNMAYIAGADVASKLIAHVGSLSRLAVLPASTIQVLGAEKSLFKHLRNRRIVPPKHGIIFQFARISGSPKKVRGKIARALANKLALAAKADHFTKRFIAEDMKKNFDARYAEIMAEYDREKKKANTAAGPSENQ